MTSLHAPWKKPPVIGISGPNTTAASYKATESQIGVHAGHPLFLGNYADRIKKHGSVEKTVAQDLAALDAIVILGNKEDIDPQKYSAEKHSKTNVETDLIRAAYEEEAIRQALNKGIPILGICGGMQRMNVLGGGSLHQHLPDLVGNEHHMQDPKNPYNYFTPVEVVKITPGSKLADIAGKNTHFYTPDHKRLPPGMVMENSFHHQAIQEVRNDFQICAKSQDGTIEAIEPRSDSPYAHQYVLGVQWHPEFGASELDPKIVSSVISAAKAYAQHKIQERHNGESHAAKVHQRTTAENRR